jgi:hypothetical protein
VPVILRAASTPNTLAGNALAGHDRSRDPRGRQRRGSTDQCRAAAEFRRAWADTLPAYLTSAADAGSFVQKGNPIPVRALNFAPRAILEPHKICVICPFVREIAEHSNIEAIVRKALTRASGLALDAFRSRNTRARQ